MKQVKLLLLSLFWIYLTPSILGNDNLGKLGDNHPAFIEGQLIYLLNNKPTPQCHASTIVETNAGMVASWFGGTHEKNTDVGIWVSRRINNKWRKNY